jgi:hypothetical protein
MGLDLGIKQSHLSLGRIHLASVDYRNGAGVEQGDQMASS